MGSHKLIGSSLHDLLVQMPRIEPSSVHIEGIPDTGVIDGIGIFFPDAGTDGIETFTDFKGLGHHNIHGKMGIEGIRQAIHRNGGCGAEIGNVNSCMDTRIRAAAAGYMHVMTYDHGNGFFQGLLDRCQIFLRLPAVISRSLISEK